MSAPEHRKSRASIRVTRRGCALALLLLGVVACLLLTLPLALRAWVGRHYRDQMHTRTPDVPTRPVAIVFGAGYWPGGRLSDALADRMDMAIELYEAGQVNKLLLTGDNRFVDYNEPAAMATYAVERGIPEGDLVLDYAGRRTYDSCYRAGAIFGVERAVLVTQEFHLPRALYTCDRLGLDVTGAVADRHRYARSPWYQVREIAALVRAWIDLNITRPVPVLGDPIPVEWDARSTRARAHAAPPASCHARPASPAAT